jgi:hypothetical protein
MISLDDLIAFCGLKAEEVQVIAEHEQGSRVPPPPPARASL